MYEIEFLSVGNADAIIVSFTRPGTGATARVVIDGGRQDNGDKIVDHVRKYFDDDHIALAVLTHPDGDHIGGLGTVVRELEVAKLLVHDIGRRGGSPLPAAKEVDSLIRVAKVNGTAVEEPFAGDEYLGGAVRILGPTTAYYSELIAEQVNNARSLAAVGRSSRALEAMINLGQRFLSSMPIEVPFDDGPGTNPRNNSSIVMLLDLPEYKALFTGDAGVPAIAAAWDQLEASAIGAVTLDFVDIPHHGSRRNASSDLLDRILGPITSASGVAA